MSVVLSMVDWKRVPGTVEERSTRVGDTTELSLLLDSDPLRSWNEKIE